MSLGELVALARRHAVAVAMVLVFAAGTAYTFKHATPTYQESATFVLRAPGTGPYSTFGGTLINTGEVVAEWIMGPQGQQQVHQEGATNAFNVALVNYSNQEFPLYDAPYLTVSASAHDPVTAHRTFTTVTRVLNDYLAARQDGAPPEDRITVSVIGDASPLMERGSTIRSFAGLLVLTIVAAFLVSRFLDRHPVRLRGQPRFRQRVIRNPTAPRSVP
jgi:hypothetical protein